MAAERTKELWVCKGERRVKTADAKDKSMVTVWAKIDSTVSKADPMGRQVILVKVLQTIQRESIKQGVW